MAIDSMKEDIAVELLCCPCCRASLAPGAGGLQCLACQRRYPIADGIPQLLADPTVQTRLDEAAYDAHHDIDEAGCETVTAMWQTVFAEQGVGGGEVLEIGCGSGQLTQALVAAPGDTRVHATDISPSFLAMAHARALRPVGLRLYACDAHQLPFRDGIFDLVVGHSVLHHLLDYPAVLRQASQLLRPGGCAIFFEPVLQGKIMVAFLASLMVRIHQKTGYGELTHEDCQKIGVMVRHITKQKEWGNDPARLASMEDKYVFDLHALLALARDCGFSSAQHRNNPAQDAVFRYNLNQHLRMAGIAEEKLADFRFLLNAAKELFIDMLPNDRYTPMGFFIFRK